MSTYLLAWNPKRANWDDIGVMSDTVQNGGVAETTWSCNKSKSIHENARIFFIRLGLPPKGIFASGYAIRKSYEDLHWEESRAEHGETCYFVDIRFDKLLDPIQDEIISRTALDSPRFGSMHWDTQSSGIRIPDEIAAELEFVWQGFAQTTKFILPDEVSYDTEILHEGACRQITVNAFERNTKARQKCLDIYGTKCAICNFDFGLVYGDEFKGYIHVHHLQPISAIGEDYQVNPATDLIPVCPNCHAAIHRRKQPYTIDEIQAKLRKQK